MTVTPSPAPPLLTDAEIVALNAARDVLECLEAQATAYAPDLPQHVYTNRGRLAEAARSAGRDLFELLNLANASRLVPLTYQQMHNRPDPADADAVESIVHNREPVPTVAVVFNTESDPPGLLGTYEGTDEDAVCYADTNGIIRHAPQDCVSVVPVAVR
jgi:hypothetical protein